jgi:hypothetical protein
VVVTADRGGRISQIDKASVRDPNMQGKRIKLVGHVPATDANRMPSAFRLEPARRRIFLLSPANASGVRAKLILGESGHSPLAERLRGEGAPLGEVFSFISGLYFRGKLTYARAFADPPQGLPGVLVITTSRGMVSPDKVVNLEELCEISSVPVAATESRYRIPLERDAQLLSSAIGDDCEVVLLGSIATPKYVEPLLGQFGSRLMFPAEFVGRGDMSRGGLLLRSAASNRLLTHIPVAGALRRGSRPPRLSPIVAA